MSFSGFENEDRIIEALNGKMFEDLDENLQQLIISSFSNYGAVIECIKQAGQNKSDLKISIDNESHTYSIKKGVCCKSENIVDWIANNNSKGAISIGKLTFQAWNRNINGGDKSEKKRGVIQLKWGSIKDDIVVIANE